MLPASTIGKTAIITGGAAVIGGAGLRYGFIAPYTNDPVANQIPSISAAGVALGAGVFAAIGGMRWRYTITNAYLHPGTSAGLTRISAGITAGAAAGAITLGVLGQVVHDAKNAPT